jgi:hypothetical protein
MVNNGPQEQKRKPMRIYTIMTSALFVIVFTICACEADAGQGIIVDCGHDFGVTDSTAVSEDWAGTMVAWDATLSGDTLVVTRRKMCGDECSRLDEIRLTPFSGDCPTSVSVRTVRTDYGSPQPTPEEIVFDEGEVQLQDWGGEVVSGRFEGKVTWTFYARLAEE